MKWVCIVLLFPSLAFAGEDCSMLGGKCKEACAVHEKAEIGAFLDCSDKQECCVTKEADKSGDKIIYGEGNGSDQKSGTGK